MSNQNLPANLSQDASVLAEATKGSLFLTRLDLLQSSSDPVKLKKPKFVAPDGSTRNPEAGQYTFGFGDSMEILGDQVLVVVGPFRPHALELKNKEVVRETFSIDDVYKDIEKQEAQLKKVKDDTRMAKAGVDVLLYLPTKEKFCVFFFKGSAKERAKGIDKLAGKLVRFESEFIPSAKFGGWYKPMLKIADGPQPIVPQLAYEEAIASFAAGSGGGDSDAQPATPAADLNQARPPR